MKKAMRDSALIKSNKNGNLKKKTTEHYVLK